MLFWEQIGFHRERWLTAAVSLRRKPIRRWGTVPLRESCLAAWSDQQSCPQPQGSLALSSHYDCHLDNMNITITLLPQNMLTAEPLKNWQITSIFFFFFSWELIAHKGMVLPLFFQLLNYLQGQFLAWTFAAVTSEELRKWCGGCHCIQIMWNLEKSYFKGIFVVGKSGSTIIFFTFQSRFWVCFPTNPAIHIRNPFIFSPEKIGLIVTPSINWKGRTVFQQLVCAKNTVVMEFWSSIY